MYSLNAEGIYTEMETTYISSLLKTKSSTYTKPEQLSEIYGKARKTIDVLT